MKKTCFAKFVSVAAAATMVFGMFSMNSLADGDLDTSSATAIQLADDGTYSQSLIEGDTSAVYRINAPYSGLYSFKVTGYSTSSSAPSGDPHIWFYDDAGSLLWDNDNAPNDRRGYYGVSYGEWLLQGGHTYYLEVKNHNDVPFSSISQTLTVTSVQFVPSYQLHNEEEVVMDSQDQTIPLTVNTDHSGTPACTFTLDLNPTRTPDEAYMDATYSVKWFSTYDETTHQPNFVSDRADLTAIEFGNTVYNAMISGSNIGQIILPFNCVFENNLRFEQGDLTNLLYDEGDVVSFPAGESADDGSDMTYVWRTPALDITPTTIDITIPDFSGFTSIDCNATDRFGNTAERGIFVYTVPSSPEELVLNTDTPVSLASISDYKVFTFTPEWDGTYTFSSSDNTTGLPFYAVFNKTTEGYECIAYDDVDPSHVDYTGNPSRFVSNDDGFLTYSNVGAENFTRDLSLTAGVKYYCVVKGLDGAAAFNVKLAGEAPAATDTPTPAPSTPTAAPAPSTPAPTAAPETGVAGFVERLYTIALDRPSDPVGKQDWIDAITLRGETGASCARGFLFSPEFLNKDISNEDFVRILYRTFFDREPEQAGYDAWVAVLNNGTPKQEVIEGFINSTEWANLCLFYGIRNGGTGVPSITVEPNEQTIDFARRLYTTCLCRNADENGLMAWARQLANQRDSGRGAAHGFFFSNEFINQNVSNEDYVTRLYRTFMNREPEQAGYEAWVARLNEGASREEVFDGFAQSIEFARICAAYGIVREL